jgi:metal-responsive CopG/Arc/MetJ family transcriptional regulator
MSSVKTAISLQRPLFEQIEAIAHDMRVPRSRVFALALEDFVRRYENRQLVDKINAAYADAPDPSEQALLRSMQRQGRQILEDEW